MAEPRTYKVRAALIELTLARVRELTREPEAVFWVFLFPIILTAILGLAFRSRVPEPLPVAVVSGQRSQARQEALESSADLKALVLTEVEAAQALARGRVVLSISDDDPPVYAYDPTQPESRAARLAVDTVLQHAAGRQDAFTPVRSEVTQPGARYVDFLVPGLLGMNVMGTGMWGIGFSLVVARNGNLLKRLVAAPAHRGQVLAAQILSRLLFLIPEAGVLCCSPLWRWACHFEAQGFCWLASRSWAPWHSAVWACWRRHARGPSRASPVS
jgi:hypothetical protein